MLRIININKYQKYAPTLLRIGISLLFLWFGVSQIINPESFLGYVPQWISPHSPQMIHEHFLELMHNITVPSVHITIMVNGIFEALFGLFLLLGLFTRVSSLALSINILILVFGLGYNDIAIRDIGLMVATLSIFLHGISIYSLDNILKNKLTNKSLIGWLYVLD